MRWPACNMALAWPAVRLSSDLCCTMAGALTVMSPGLVVFPPLQLLPHAVRTSDACLKSHLARGRCDWGQAPQLLKQKCVSGATLRAAHQGYLSVKWLRVGRRGHRASRSAPGVHPSPLPRGPRVACMDFSAPAGDSFVADGVRVVTRASIRATAAFAGPAFSLWLSLAQVGNSRRQFGPNAFRKHGCSVRGRGLRTR